MEKYRRFLILFLILFCVKGFCQNNGEPLELEEDTAAEENNSQIDKALQKNFVIMESVRPHELNPQVTSYASDSQLLSGLYEGLFSYDPKTLEPLPALNMQLHQIIKSHAIKNAGHLQSARMQDTAMEKKSLQKMYVIPGSSF